MFFRDFRHQVEPNEDKQRLFLEKARERFYSNLSLLQLQLPELAEQLRTLKPSQYTMTCDRSGHGNCIHGHTLTMAWPPADFEPGYEVRYSGGEAPALLAAELHNTGQQLVQLLNLYPTPFVLLYVPSLELFYASLHMVDWLPVLQNSQLIVQLESHVSATERFTQDLRVLAEHGVPTTAARFATIKHDQEQLAAEQVWHFQQSLLYNHDCDPVLRLHSHKFKWHQEFQLQNLLIKELRNKPLAIDHEVDTLILCGTNLAIFEAAIQIPGLKRVILVNDEALSAQQAKLFASCNIQVHECIGSETVAIGQFLQLLASLSPEVPWQCRLYQAESHYIAKRLRQYIELELRYIVQPAMGVRRCLDAAHHVTMTPQHLLTRRTKLPKCPVLLLGNGPSLETTIRAIHAGLAEGYLLVSCGTTLATLSAHNITPHVHIELEFVSGMLTELSDDYLAQIHFCAPLAFHAGTRERFASHSSFILAEHAFDELVPSLPDDSIKIYGAFPTVLNLGIALAGQLGVKQLWLAGFDLAFQDEKRHHAAGSLYDSHADAYIQTTGELIEVTAISKKKLLTKREFQFSATQAQHLLHTFPKMLAYQLSDGLDLGAKYCAQLEPCSTRLNWLPSKCQLPATQVNWQRSMADYRCVALVEWARDATPTQLQALLKEPTLKLAAAKLTRRPAVYWTLGLRRSLAALLLRLQVNNLAELPHANSVFDTMLEDLEQAEAKI